MAGSIFFIADTHFGDDNIRRYENRPFLDADAMDRELIRRWNDVVKKEDCVYVLGDFGAVGREASVLGLLNGEIFLVKGNHDVQSNEYYRKAGFKEVYDLPVILEDFWILSHKPLYVNRNMPYANIFGHIHSSPMYTSYSSQHFCASVERIDYTPVSMEEAACKVRESAKEAARTGFERE